MKKNNTRNKIMKHVNDALFTVLNLPPETIFTESTVLRKDTKMDDVYSITFMMKLEIDFQQYLDENYFVPTEVIEREQMYQYRPLSELLDYLEQTVDISKLPTTTK